LGWQISPEEASFSKPSNMSHINTIEGIGESHTKKFAEIGVTTVEHLLQAGATPKGRKELAAKTGFSEHHVLKWVNQADLFRVKGIGRQYAELLQASGVDSVKELAQRIPDHLHEKIKASNEAKHQVHVIPNVETLTTWVEEAKQLPRVVTY
jgi:predicted flap endonuclease-1-like 5' DNA nuclease